MKVVICNGSQKSPSELGKKIAQGGAGAIYLVKGQPGWVAKIYMHPNSTQINYEAAARERERIEAMLSRPPKIQAPHLRQYHQLAWPLSIIENPAGQMLGFTMSKLPLDKACDLESLITKSGRAAEGLPENYIVRLFASHNIAALVRELHREGHYIVDMKPKNMSIYKTDEAQGLVAILDSDGFSINSITGKRFPAEMFSSEYIAPELLKNNFKPDKAGEYQDQWALAVIIFRLLNNSTHPYSGVYRGNDSQALDDHVKADRYAYGRKAHPDISPRPGSIHEYLDDETRDLFDRSFGKDQYKRPSAKEWRDHLQALTDFNNQRIFQCKQDATHWHFSKGCPFCQRAQIMRKQQSVQIIVPQKIRKLASSPVITPAPSARPSIPISSTNVPLRTQPQTITKKAPTYTQSVSGIPSGPGKPFKLRHLIGALGLATGVYAWTNRTPTMPPLNATQPAVAPFEAAQLERQVSESRALIKLAQLNDALSASNLEVSKSIFTTLTPEDSAGLDLEQLRGRIALLQGQYDTLMTEVQNQIKTGRWDEAKSSLNRIARISPSDSKLPSLKAEIDEKMAQSEKSRVDSSSLSTTLKDFENTREP
jgi:serine/threonine protein kinase